MSTSSDPDSNTAPSSEEPQGTELEVKKSDIVPRATAGDLPESAVDGHPGVGAKAVGPSDGETPPPPQPPASSHDGTGTSLPPDVLAAILESLATAAALVRSADEQGRKDVEPQARKMDGIDLGTYILSSRYRTVNAILLLLAVAACVAALAFDSHANPVFTVSLTSVSTIAAALGISAAKKRHERRQGSQPEADDTNQGSDSR